MKFDLVHTTKFPRQLVFRTHRDRLVELVPYLPSVDHIRLRSREVAADGTVALTHLWKGSMSAVPALVRPMLRPEMLTWLDHTVWDPLHWRCDWTIELPTFPEVFDISGTNRFFEVDGGCEVHLDGEFHVDTSKIPNLPPLVTQSAVSTVEKFIVSLLVPVIERSGQAVVEFLENQ